MRAGQLAQPQGQSEPATTGNTDEERGTQYSGDNSTQTQRKQERIQTRREEHNTAVITDSRNKREYRRGERNTIQR
ncbi:UNVERIFIED_CONTAM: hypothetical protein FKN15_012844 [Acipenser sinensis]